MRRIEWGNRDFGIQLLALAMLCVAWPAAADDGRPRYVSGAGRDQGDCLNKFRPCRSLSYAIAHAGKGDAIRAAEGSYAVRDSKQLYDLLAASGRLAGGFSRYSGYSERNASGATRLIGVPPQLRERFEAAGFTVIVDTKSLEVSGEEARRMRKLTAQVTAAEQSHGAAACVANLSAGFACQSISLLSHLSLQQLAPASTIGNDVWGFTDLNTGREYALMGLQNGVAVVDVTDPQAPEQVAAASGSATTWRDIKIYQRYDASAGRWRAYAYVTADAVTDFLMVLDLSRLPNGVERVTYSSDFRAAHNAYLVNADYSFGLAQSAAAPQLGIAGSGINSGNYRLYALEDPRAPQLLNVATGGYAHDLASFPVGDARKNGQCVNALSQPQCQVLSDFNENTVDIWDITDASAPQRLSSQPYSNAAYVHSGWWTEDGRYLLVHDELDERNFGLNTTVRIFDLNDLRAPTLAASWVGPTRATDHNGYVKGNRYYISNYSEGLTVLDLSDPRSPTRVGYFDTHPASNQVGFVGAWGVYPFFASGTVAVGDINSGLYLLRNETLASPAGSLVMSSATLAGSEGQSLGVTVNRGGTSGAVSVQLEVLYATASAADASLASTVLSWADGETQAKTATLNFTADAQSENLELLLVRLKNPQGGASIGYPDTALVTIEDPGSATALRPLEPAPIVEEARGKVLVAITRRGSASGEARLSYRTVPGGSYGGFTAAQGELLWSPGDAGAKIVTVALDPATLAAGQSGSFQIELFGALNASLESTNGTTVSALPVTVTVNDTATPSTTPAPTPTPTPTPAPPARRSGGGGDMSWWILLALALLSGCRRMQAPAARH